MEKRNSKSLALIIAAVVVVVAAVVVILIVTHNKNSSNNSLSTAQANSAKQQIESDWKTFFAKSTSLSTRENLLQGGSKFAQPIVSEFAAFSSQTFGATVASVSLVNSTSANVVYAIVLNGQSVLSGQKGQALLLNNTWKVSNSTICQLLSLGGEKPSVCQNY